MKIVKKLGYRKSRKFGGGEQFSLSIPISYIRKLNIDIDNREIYIYFDEENKKIIIEKYDT